MGVFVNCGNGSNWGFRNNEFVQVHRDSAVMILTDCAVENDGLGLGSCAAVLVPTGTDNTEKVVTEVFSILTDNVEAEVCGITLAMDMAIQHYTTVEPEDKLEDLYILSDCKADHMSVCHCGKNYCPFRHRLYENLVLALTIRTDPISSVHRQPAAVSEAPPADSSCLRR